MSKIDVAPLLTIIVFYFIWLSVICLLGGYVYIPWIPIIIVLVVFAFSFIGYSSFAWFLVIFIISLSLIMLFLSLPNPIAVFVTGIIVGSLSAYGLLWKKYYWLATGLALILAFVFVYSADIINV